MMASKSKRGPGQPPKELTEEQIIQVESLGAVLSVEQIAHYFGFGKTTFYALMKKNPEILERYKKGKAKAIGSVAKGLLAQAREGNTTAAMFYLKTQAGWREQKQVEIVGDNDAKNVLKVQLVDASDLRDDKALLNDEV
jgi:hypothetical protein